MSKLGNFFDVGGGTTEAAEDSADVSTWLHGDDAELVLFVDPDKESLLVVVEDTASFGPLSVQTASLKVLVALLEQEVVIDQLLAVSLREGCERVVLAL